MPASGGTPVELTTLSEGEFSHRWPEFLPNGKAVLFAAGPQGINLWDEATIEAVVLETGERRVVHRGGTYPRYASSSHLIFALEATLFAMPFDADRIETTGEPSPVIEGVRVNPGGGALYAWADDGTLVYVPGAGAVIERKLVWVDREGNASPLTETLGDWETPRFSRDGQRLAVRKQDETGQQSWILELSRGTLTRLTFEEGLRPLWSPDGETVFFASTRAGSYNIFSKPADSSGPAEQLTTGTIFRVPASITSDGKTLVFRQGGDAGSPRLDIGMMRLEGEGEPEMLLDTSFDEHTPKLSRIGKQSHQISIRGSRTSCAGVSRKIARTVCVTLGTLASRFRKYSHRRGPQWYPRRSKLGLLCSRGRSPHYLPSPSFRLFGSCGHQKHLPSTFR